MNAREFAERALLGTLINQPGRIRQIDFLQPEDYHDPMHEAVHRHLAEMVAEKVAAVEWGTFYVGGPSEADRYPEPTDAEQAYRDTTDLLDNIQDMDRNPQEWGENLEARRRAIADAVAGNLAQYPGLDRHLLPHERAVLAQVLPLSSVDPYQVPGVDPVALFERIHASGELGTSQLDGAGSINPVTLHTLMATAPPAPHPRTYALMVLEASMRRQVEQTGMRVGQVVEESHELTGMLTAVERALDQVSAVQARWEQVTGTGAGTDRGRVAATLAPLGERDTDPIAAVAGIDASTLLDIPTVEEVEAGEQALLRAVLASPGVRDHVLDRVVPGDFADRATGNTFRTTMDLHRNHQDVDPVIVAWAQQRYVAEYGSGLSPDQLAMLSQTPATYPGRVSADIVMRGSLVRITQHAADTVRAAAQQPGLQPGDVLHTTRLAYEAVTAAAARMNGRDTNPARLADLSAPPSSREAFTSEGRTGTTPPGPAARLHRAAAQGPER
uniref:DnaB-like helicase N-terminal domain-containing protein n=1 Tax=Amycolatopsis sp. CA-151526 TaxID=3239921 RepID=UPI003F4982A0